MSEVKKITQNQLDKINYLKKEAVEIATSLGELSYQKIILELQIDNQKKKIVDLRKEENAIFEELRSEYGNINIDLTTGEFTIVE